MHKVTILSCVLSNQHSKPPYYGKVMVIQGGVFVVSCFLVSYSVLVKEGFCQFFLFFSSIYIDFMCVILGV